MGVNRILGIVLLVGGALLLYFGYTASQGIGEQIHETFMGRFTDSTTWYFIGGAVACAAGVVLLALKGRA